MQRNAGRETDVDEDWSRYLRDRRICDRNALMLKYAHLVEIQTARLARRLARQIGYDEIRSAAFDGLLQAVESYDPKRSARFETFCQRRIQGAVMDWLRKLDPQSRTVRMFEKRRAKVKQLLDTEIGQPPSASEIAARMQLSLGKYENLHTLSKRGNEVHFSALESQEHQRLGGHRRGWDVEDQAATDPARDLARRMLAEHISKGLNRVERTILVLYYYEELTMLDIGMVLDLSESRVSQIHKDVLGRLRQKFGVALAEELAV